MALYDFRIGADSSLPNMDLASCMMYNPDSPRLFMDPLNSLSSLNSFNSFTSLDYAEEDDVSSEFSAASGPAVDEFRPSMPVLAMSPVNPDGSIPLHARRRSLQLDQPADAFVGMHNLFPSPLEVMPAPMTHMMSGSASPRTPKPESKKKPGKGVLVTTFDSRAAEHSDKKHRCKICHKRFTRPSSLQTHLYSHTGERPFACEFGHCNRHFSVVSNLRRHMKIHDPARARRRKL